MPSLELETNGLVPQQSSTVTCGVCSAPRADSITFTLSNDSLPVPMHSCCPVAVFSRALQASGCCEICSYRPPNLPTTEGLAPGGPHSHLTNGPQFPSVRAHRPPECRSATAHKVHGASHLILLSCTVDNMAPVPVPESLLKKRQRDDAWAATKATAVAEAKAKARSNRKLIFKKAEAYVKEYRQQVRCQRTLVLVRAPCTGQCCAYAGCLLIKHDECFTRVC
jgi:hypothetical protein